MKFVSKSADETRAIAAKIAEKARPGDVFALKGDLGAGKTVFSGGFARALGVTDPVCSPTFTIAQEYALNIPGKPELRRMNHLDVYRISDAYSALAFGVEDYLLDSAAVTLVEWPERIDDILPPGTTTVEITHVDENTREIVVGRKIESGMG